MRPLIITGSEREVKDRVKENEKRGFVLVSPITEVTSHYKEYQYDDNRFRSRKFTGVASNKKYYAKMRKAE